MKKIYAFWGQKVKLSPQSPKTEFAPQNQYGRVIYLSIRNFTSSTWSIKKYTFWVQKGRFRPPGPKNGIKGTKAVWSSDISIGNFTWSKKKYTFRGKKG
jgi:hypothetical protein